MNNVLRKCQYCGLEAHNESDLEQFTKAKRYRYGRRNICKPCFAKILRNGGQYNNGHQLACQRWLDLNHAKHTETMLKRITFKGKRVYLSENPRKGLCSKCGALIPEKQLRQAPMHHAFYNEENPIDGTEELCDSCHTSFHNAERLREVKD